MMSTTALKEKLERAKAEREKLDQAISKYEEELKQRRTLGVPVRLTKTGESYFFIKEDLTECGRIVPLPTFAVNQGLDQDKCRSRYFNAFPTKESAEYHIIAEHLWNQALVNQTEGKPIDIKVLLPLLPDGWVAMDHGGFWGWYKDKPSISLEDAEWNSGTLYWGLSAFNLEPAKDWKESLVRCGIESLGDLAE